MKNNTPVRDNFLSKMTPETLARVEAIRASPEYIARKARNARIRAGTASKEEIVEFRKSTKWMRDWREQWRQGIITME